MPLKSGAVIRQAGPEDLSILSEMCHSLWPETSSSTQAKDLRPLLAGTSPGNLSSAICLAEEPDGSPVGFIHIGLRSHADGCEPCHPVGSIEGWYVVPEYRRKKIGAELVGAAEKCSREQGCTEMASDTWLDHPASHLTHQALGFEVVDRCVYYRKQLR